MKKIATTIICLLGAMALYGAQNVDIKAFQTKVASHSTYSDRFQETRTPSATAAKKAVETLEGQLDYKADYLSMVYDNGELFLIEGNNMTIRRSGKPEQKFDTSKNLMMRGLQHALLYSFCGKLEDLAAEQKAGLEVTKDGGNFKAVISATKKQARGYSKIIVLYNASGKLLWMQMDEFNGASTLYKFL